MIGRYWAILFSSFGYECQLYDINLDSLSKAKDLIAQDLQRLSKAGQMRGKLTQEERLKLISITDNLATCVQDVTHIQECVFENLELKQQVFEDIDGLLPADDTNTTICSSTSVQMPSSVFSRVTTHKNQCLVAHPINPPILVRLVELVTHKDTRQDIVEKTRNLMNEIGQKPVILRKEISGFALNRIQYACFQETFRLVYDGVMSPEDVDTVVSEGLGPRYAFMGPWMTGHLNAAGLDDYLKRYNEGIYNVSKECQPLLKIEGQTAEQIIESMNKLVPLEKLDDKRVWRDKCLLELLKIKDNLGEGH